MQLEYDDIYRTERKQREWHVLALRHEEQLGTTGPWYLRNRSWLAQDFGWDAFGKLRIPDAVERAGSGLVARLHSGADDATTSWQTSCPEMTLKCCGELYPIPRRYPAANFCRLFGDRETYPYDRHRPEWLRFAKLRGFPRSVWSKGLAATHELDASQRYDATICQSSLRLWSGTPALCNGGRAHAFPDPR